MARKTTSLLLAIALSCRFFPVAAAEIKTNMARMQAMDKITGKVSEIDVPVGGEAFFGSFSIVARTCVTRPPEETPENFAFIDVVDNYKSEKPVNIFKGWMMSSTPALNAVEHPIYDVWLLKCYDGKLEGKKLLSQQELTARDAIPMMQTENSEEEENKKDVANSVAAEETEVSKQTPAEENKSAVPQNITKESQQDNEPEVVSVVITDVETAETDAPKPLLEIETQPSAETGDEAPLQNLTEQILQEENAAAVNEPVVTFEEAEENGFGDEPNE